MMDYGTTDWPAQPPLSALIDSVNHADLFELCGVLPDQSVDMILCDLPYGTTACSWDVIIPFAPMWEAFQRIVKPLGAVVLTASQPFTSALIMSNIDWFKYEWIWIKNQSTQMMNARYRPLMQHENVLVFSPTRLRSNQFVTDKMTYNPQGVVAIHEVSKGKSQPTAINNMRGNIDKNYIKTMTNFPKTTLSFDVEVGLHPTQKPVSLFQYLIRTYSEIGQLILDPCVGSGTTAIAAREEGRRFIVGDSSAEYAQIARDRVAAPYTPNFLQMLEAV